MLTSPCRDSIMVKLASDCERTVLFVPKLLTCCKLHHTDAKYELRFLNVYMYLQYDNIVYDIKYDG